mmetsp:Transcript_15382/g.32859  ORF Transcript_15382/g.32859 Transcript_15382/m.32859 type:complete len:156 (-) Transcript_15382:25-492(-)
MAKICRRVCFALLFSVNTCRCLLAGSALNVLVDESGLVAKRLIGSLRLPLLSTLNHPEFRLGMRMQPKLDDHEIRLSFDALSHGYSQMDCSAFINALNRLSLGIYSSEIKEMFLEMDQNHDGRISFEEFRCSVHRLGFFRRVATLLLTRDDSHSK